MRRMKLVFGIMLLVPALAAFVFAQDDALVGRWEGKIQSMQGERPTAAIFKKNGGEYAGKTLGLRPGTEVELRELKVDGGKVTAKADIETPQATLTVNYSFTLAGEELKGQGALDFGGQTVTFEINLKRVSRDTSGPLVTAAQAQQGGGGPGGGGRPRNDVAQPQQKQSIDYFIGQWTYSFVGRESGLGPVPRDCTVAFTKRADGTSADGAISCKHDGGVLTGTAVLAYDDAAKTLSVTEKFSNGVTIASKGNWSSPISIRFTVDAVKVKNQTLQLKRTISIVGAHSFTVTEELSEDGGPFVRLGNAVYSKAAK